MGNDTPKLTDDQVLEYARQGLEAHLPLSAEGKLEEERTSCMMGLPKDPKTRRPLHGKHT